MTNAEELLGELKDVGISLIAGVPCSTLGGLIAAASVSSDIRYVPAANEGDAVAIAAGAWLAGGSGAVVIQNSGLGNAVSPLTSLIVPFEIPLLMLIGWRGYPGGSDEPQHRLMGEITPSLLRLCGFEVHEIGSRHTTPGLAAGNAPRQAYLVANDRYRGAAPASKSSSLGRDPEVFDARAHGVRPSRLDYIGAALADLPPDAAVISTTGKCSRELYELGDEPRFFYQVGSMGCASSIALGVAACHPGTIVVLDGDGAALMRLGALATIGAEHPTRFIHIVLDNEAHESTGGQPTAARSADLAGIAVACGYRMIGRCDSIEGLSHLLRWVIGRPGPAFLHAKARGEASPGLGRPEVTPAAVALRFRTWLEHNR